MDWRLVREALTIYCISPTTLDSAQAILAHAAPLTLKGEPSITNERLARVIRYYWDALKIPIVVQGEVERCLRDVPIDYRYKSLEQHESDTYIRTIDIARWQKSVCDAHGWSCVIVMSFHPHLWRVVRVTEKLGLTVRVPYIPAIPFDRESVYARTRHECVFAPLEIAQRLDYIRRGWI